MSFRTKRALSLEKFSSRIPKERLENLVNAVDEFIQKGDFSDSAYRHSKIPLVIAQNHNISVSMMPWKSPKINSNYYRICINAPLLTKNNTLIQNYEREFLVNEDMDVFRSLKDPKKLFGIVDLEEGKVDGILSDVNCHLCITPNFFSSGKFTAEEIAEKIVHEVGHIMLYFACLTDVVNYNYAIVHSVERILGFTNEKLKIKFVEELGDAIGTRFDPDIVRKTNSKDELYSLLVTETAISRRNETGSFTYANHAWEKLADNFVTKMGGGVALASGLIKLDKLNSVWLRDPSYNSNVFHYVTEAAKGIFAIAGTLAFGTAFAAGLGISAATYITATNEVGNVHDKPEERLRRIELGLIERLKNKELSEEERKDTLNQVSVLRSITKDIKDKPTISNFISRLVSGRYWGKGRKDAINNNYMLELEKLNSNSLFVAKSKLGDY